MENLNAVTNVAPEVVENVVPEVTKAAISTSTKVASGVILGTSGIGCVAIVAAIGFGVFKLVKHIRNKKSVKTEESAECNDVEWKDAE